MFGWEYPPVHCGGLGVACQGIVRGLKANGAHVTLVLPHDAASEDGVSILTPSDLGAAGLISVATRLHPYDSAETFAARIATQQGDPALRELYGTDLGEAVERFTASAVRLTKNVPADIVHTHDWMTLGAGVRASRSLRKPLVAHVHATELDRTEFHPNAWIYAQELKGLQAADHVLAVSSYTKNLLVREYGIRADKVTVLHNGAFATPAHNRPIEKHGKRHPLVLFLGRLTVQKGVTYFLHAARKIADHRPDVRFVIAGDGYLLPQLIAQSCDMGLADRIIFAGRVSNAEARQLYRKADCFVMPSVSEPFGLVALEAITHGAPVVMSRQSGAAEVIQNSLVVDFWDTDKMADCILTVLREEPLRRAMHSQTPRILRNLTWERQAGKIIAAYRHVIGGRTNEQLTINN